METAVQIWEHISKKYILVTVPAVYTFIIFTRLVTGLNSYVHAYVTTPYCKV